MNKGKNEVQSMQEMLEDMEDAKERGLSVRRGQSLYKQQSGEYQEEKLKQEFIICAKQAIDYEVITIDAAIEYFLENYVKNNCKLNTYRRYRRMLKYYIAPFYKNKNLNDINCNDIQEFYYFCKGRNTGT